MKRVLSIIGLAIMPLTLSATTMWTYDQTFWNQLASTTPPSSIVQGFDTHGVEIGSQLYGSPTFVNTCPCPDEGVMIGGVWRNIAGPGYNQTNIAFDPRENLSIYSLGIEIAVNDTFEGTSEISGLQMSAYSNADGEYTFDKHYVNPLGEAYTGFLGIVSDLPLNGITIIGFSGHTQYSITDMYTAEAVPEPASLTLFGIGGVALIALIMLRRLV